ncbi:MAG: hypothetical protein MUF64_08080 [Polyangiaceae bacterium]|nr:hypothetical protein [Polyangiaceae bacterium]
MLRIERDIEARLRGQRRADALRLPVRELILGLGDLALDEAIWALVAVEAARQAWAGATVGVQGDGEGARLYRGVFPCGEWPRGAQGVRLVVDVSQPQASRARLHQRPEGHLLRVPGNPGIHPKQHRAGDWFDGALCAGLAARNEAPRLPLTRALRHAGAVLLKKALGGSWRAAVAWIPSGPRAHEAPREAAWQTARWLGGLVVQVGGEAPRGPFLDREREDPGALASALACCAVCITDDSGWAQVAAAAGAPVVQASRGLDTRRRGPASPLGAAVGGEPRVDQITGLARRVSVLGFPADRLRRWL